MSQILKNRCTVILKEDGCNIGTYRPTQRKFYSLQKILEPYRIIYPKAKTFQSKYRIVLKQEDIKMGTYKVPQKMLEKIKADIEKFRSVGALCKKVRCIETGQIFENAHMAAKWAAFAQERSYCDFDLIKQCCRGKQKTSYGYHWEFVNEEIERVKERLNKRFNNK